MTCWILFIGVVVWVWIELLNWIFNNSVDDYYGDDDM